MAKKERKVVGPVELTDMAYGGEAVGRHEGMVVFAYLGAVGDIANVDVTIVKKSFARGSIVELIEPSPLRTTPPCPYFGNCGGCQWQHVRYEEQLKSKQHLVAEAFERIGHLPFEVQPTLGMEDPWHYRNTMEFGFTFDSEPGLRRLRGHRIVPIGECIISRPEINEALELLWDCFYRDKMAEILPHNAFVRVGDGPLPRTVVGLWGHGEWPQIADRMVQDRPDLIAGVVQRKGRGSEKGRTLFGQDYTEHELLGKRYRASIASFFQVNRTQTEVLIQTALGFLQPQPGQVILDAYSGVGTFSLQLAEKVGKVVAVESSPSANVDARINGAGLANLELVEGNFGEVPLPVERVDGVVIDPPRGGVAPEGLDGLLRLSPERIVYVSCDPTTLARDAALLVGAGYRLERVQPIDLFPQTYHVETVALFLR
ncbi:MAG: 23S rRNA (uracil(1939)-C(5))-methyltransferase RlmD [Chloroflexota bacterium]